MTEPWERYDNKWTELSYKELENFALWMNRMFGSHPTVIGGWAVYMYNPGMGSRDIDVLMQGREIKDKVVNIYCANNGYELKSRAFGEDEWIKYLVNGDAASEIYLDVCTLKDVNIVHGTNIEIPWAIATKWQRSLKVGEADIYIPGPEPLLVLKCKAAWDRAYDFKQKSDDFFLKQKLTKDKYDILSILKTCEIDPGIIADILSRYKFKKYFTSRNCKKAHDFNHGMNC